MNWTNIYFGLVGNPRSQAALLSFAWMEAARIGNDALLVNLTMNMLAPYGVMNYLDWAGVSVSEKDLELAYADRRDAAEEIEKLRRAMGGLQNGQISNLLSALESKQAKIDALMLEFCPGEMPAAQAENWAKHQRPVDENTRDAINSADSGHPHIAKLRAEAETLRRDAERWQYFASCPQTALMLGSELDPNSDQDWEAECRMLADAAITEQALQALADEAQSMGLYDPHCPRCGGTMLPGVAIQNTAVGIQDMGEVCTMSYGGPGKMIECLKCEKCGYSVT